MSSSDLLGWQQTRWGMTDPEIVQAVGSDKVRRIARETFQKMYADLIIPNVDIGQYSFDVIFQMGEGSDRLAQVLIKHMADPQKEPRGPRDTARRVLSERFGPGARLGTSDDWQWTFPTTTIELNTFYIEEIVADVAFRFFPTNSGVRKESQSAF